MPQENYQNRPSNSAADRFVSPAVKPRMLSDMGETSYLTEQRMGPSLIRANSLAYRSSEQETLNTVQKWGRQPSVSEPPFSVNELMPSEQRTESETGFANKAWQESPNLGVKTLEGDGLSTWEESDEDGNITDTPTWEEVTTTCEELLEEPETISEWLGFQGSGEGVGIFSPGSEGGGTWPNEPARLVWNGTRVSRRVELLAANPVFWMPMQRPTLPPVPQPFLPLRGLMLLQNTGKKQEQPGKPTVEPKPGFYVEGQKVCKIITGFTKPVAASKIVSKIVKLVLPKGVKGENVVLKFKPARQDQAKVVDKLVKGNTIEFRVKGQKASQKQEGDITIQAEDRDKRGVFAEVKVVVVIPKEIAKPYPEGTGTVEGVNVNMDVSTSPAFLEYALPENETKLATFYGHWLTITVNDQFGETLNGIYADSMVAEDMKNSGIFKPINQKITNDGTYKDPVGVISVRRKPVQKTVPDPKNPGSMIKNPKIATFLKGAKFELRPTPPSNPLVQNIRVKVGGHELNPSVKNRKVEAKAPNTVNITWK